MKKRTREQTGLIPRSILRTFERFRKQLLPGAEMLVIQEFRISRYQVIVSVRCLITLIFVPLFINILSKSFLIRPGIEYLWNQNHNEIFLNSYQENRALHDLHQFEEKVYFDSFVTDFAPSSNVLLQKQSVEIAKNYNLESIEAISNLFADFLSFLSLSVVFLLLKPQIIILKAFLSESLYSLSDTTKSFLLILGTDLLVGFHSPRGWEVFLEWLLRHFGLPENSDFMSLFVATFPVFLDTVFKYWIFRSLNKISPSTVATYHNIIE
uniref:Potassium/proton antiporter CemA n=3 Tax=Chlorella vulgaris TaxID=3077 RepID=CEMA_CHLVU|nr:envelope membrane protein [Chlorella vulgaris]P56349.1 RecName: Full=Potassium/proton antiporter CemA; AltName: Full=Chloroplast envelope membrane protein A; Short=CemA [Chlorella vulgaris]QSJ54258.1 envelope membrane protein [Chlorella vulgaris]QSV10926.1 envelope membrane protein [Chlorella vulgaris]BAA20753.1 ycf10 [Chlorella vulgaris]